MTIHRAFLSSVLLLLAGCTPVSPWQKREFAKPHMAFSMTPARAKFTQHIYQSKEAAYGGYGVEGGGCGCN
jgi:starvation-inducible outer membrane lipoprotein